MDDDDDVLVIYQGASLHVVFDVTDDANVAFPLKTNGYTAAAMQVRPRLGSPDLMLDLSTQAGTIVIEPDNVTGEVHVDAGADLTGAITKTKGVYDCLAWNPSKPTDVIVIASGAVAVKRRVTNKP